MVVTLTGYARLVLLADTDPEIRRRQLATYRAMSPQQRVDIALRLSEEVREIAMEGIRRRNPASNEAEAHRQWLRLLHGRRMAAILSALLPAVGPIVGREKRED
jgi:hypothetical protein